MIRSVDNDCVDCGINTWEIHEYYMVDFDLWHAHGVGEGMLCIGCLENRLSRPLTAADFLGTLINTEPENDGYRRSGRLRNRLENND